MVRKKVNAGEFEKEAEKESQIQPDKQNMNEDLERDPDEKPKKSRMTKGRKKRKPDVVEHPLSSEKEFTNREIGWLHFNRRVLSEAEDARNPLLERLKFLSISVSNLDEFFMKRVGGLKRHIAYGVTAKSSDGQTPQQQLIAIRNFVNPMVKDQANCLRNLIQPTLEQNEIHLIKWKDLSSEERDQIKKYYAKNIFPVLTPLSVDPGHPFPFISNLSTNLGFMLKHPERDEKLFARLKIPKVLPQWIPASKYRFVHIVDVIRENLTDLFPALEVQDMMLFRVTRNADSDQDPDDTEDLLEMIEEELRQRRFAEVVRLEVAGPGNAPILEFLMQELDLKDEDIFEMPCDFDLTDFQAIIDLPFPKLRFEPFHPVVSSQWADDPDGFFQTIKTQDQFVHMPFDSFAASVEKFVRLASEDSKVLAIKMTLYRTGDNSPFIRSLIRAAENGKQVVCLVELKARFDEERNIFWAQELENAGVHVVYGILGLKTHAKTTLVVRQEDSGVQCYAHIGTGNYNMTTSRLYTDLGLLTGREEITSDIVELFHYLTGRSLKKNYNHLLIAPVNMLSRFKSMIEREAENVKLGKPGHIIAKFNNMEENDLASSLYRSSQAGVSVDLIVRGFCCIRPGVAGMSERVRVVSIIGRFLEHSRIFYFRNGAEDPIDGEFYMGSADWMYRNLHARVEAVVPILDRSLRMRCWDILQLYLNDHRQTWRMKSDGSYEDLRRAESGVHDRLLQLAKAQSIKLNNLESE